MSAENPFRSCTPASSHKARIDHAWRFQGHVCMPCTSPVHILPHMHLDSPSPSTAAHMSRRADTPDSRLRSPATFRMQQERCRLVRRCLLVVFRAVLGVFYRGAHLLRPSDLWFRLLPPFITSQFPIYLCSFRVIICILQLLTSWVFTSTGTRSTLNLGFWRIRNRL